MMLATLGRMLSGSLFSEVQAETKINAITVDEYSNPTLAWQSGEALMADRNRAVMMRRIDQLVGIPPDHFKILYEGVVVRFANYCQLMPASENHHHARLGGLLDHSLDVAVRALGIRRGYLLPPNKAPEVMARESDRWTFGVFMAALFHDIGKPAMNLEVSMYDAAGRSLGLWTPGAGPMKDVDRYYIRFRADRLYEQHERVASFVGRLLLPELALNWICEDKDLMSGVLATLAGDFDHADMLGVIVSQADGQSVAADLGSGQKARVSSTSKRPLSEMLLMALRQLFEEGRFHINRPGAEAWVTETDLWLVSKIGADRMREWLIGEGITSVPSSNLRIFDELQQHKICISTPKDTAVWSTKVTLGEFRHGLTMLRFPIETIWPDPERRPASLEGDVLPQSNRSMTEDEDADRQNTHRDDTVAKNGEAAVSSGSAFGDECDELAPMDDVPELPFVVGGSETKARAKPVTEEVEKSALSNDSGRVNWQDTSQKFLDWLAEGILEERLKINIRSGMLWSVEEGLFMRTPTIYQDFAAAFGIDDGKVSKAVQSRNIFLTNTRRPPTTLVFYNLTVDKGKDMRLKGNVIVDPKDVLGTFIPAPHVGMKRAKDGRGRY